MKTEPEIRKVMDNLEDEMQEVNSKLENVLLKSEYLKLHSVRNKLKDQYNILLEVLKWKQVSLLRNMVGVKLRDF